MPSEPEYDPYEEDNNAAHLYNPFRGHIAPNIDSLTIEKLNIQNRKITIVEQNTPISDNNEMNFVFSVHEIDATQP